MAKDTGLLACYCGKPQVSEGLCRDHWIEKKEERYLDNTDMNDLGLLRWARDLLPDYLPQQTPLFHLQILMLLFSLFDPFYKNRYERQRNIISFRGSSKSTLINMIFVLYLLCHNGQKMKIRNIRGEIIEVEIKERFIVITSETGMSAEDFVVRLRDELTVNENLRYFYKHAISDAYDADDGQMTRRAFKFNKCFVMGAGVGQQIRGKIKGAYRATLMLCDDIYSENNTITEEGRKKVKKWFDYAVLNSIDDLNGKIIVVGTILHEDTVLVENMRAENWKSVMYKVMPLENFYEFIDQHLSVNHQKGTCKLPFQDLGLSEEEEKTRQREYFAKIQASKDWGLAWKERIDLYFLALKYQEAVSRRTVSSLFQEYFHEITSAQMKQIKPEYFRREPFEIFKQYNHTWYRSQSMNEGKPMVITIEIGIDTATGTTDGDDSVVTVAGRLPNGIEVIIETDYGKYAARDIKKNMTAEAYGKVEMDKDKLVTVGFLDEALRKAIKYGAKTIKIGYAGTEKTYIEMMRQLTYINNQYDIIVIGRKQDDSEGKKRERIAHSLAHRYQAFSIIHAEGLKKLEYQLEFLQSCREDDVADSAEIALYNIQVPSHLEINTLTPPEAEPVRWKKLAPIQEGYDWRV